MPKSRRWRPFFACHFEGHRMTSQGDRLPNRIQHPLFVLKQVVCWIFPKNASRSLIFWKSDLSMYASRQNKKYYYNLFCRICVSIVMLCPHGASYDIIIVVTSVTLIRREYKQLTYELAYSYINVEETGVTAASWSRKL